MDASVLDAEAVDVEVHREKRDVVGAKFIPMKTRSS
jgi:hypothetical protein